MMKNTLIFNFDDADDAGLIPDFCDVRVVFMLVLLVELLAIILSMTSLMDLSEIWSQLALFSLVMQWIGLLDAAVLCQLRDRLNALSLKATLITSFSIMMMISLLVAFVAANIETLLGTRFRFETEDYFVLRTCVMSAAIYAVVLRYLYIQQQWKIVLRAGATAEIQALKARIRPHFLFNSMNTIASLISFAPEKAEKAIEDLSDLFRASLVENTTHTLGDELALIDSYLDIETLRLGDRLKYHSNIEKTLVDEEIPSLILQPLVENAIYHGIEPLPEGGEITISAVPQGDHLELSVSNPLTDRTRDRQHKGNQMAQENIRQRLVLVYGGRASFTTNETKEAYRVTLKIPVGVREPLQ